MQSVNPGNSPANWDDLIKLIDQKGEIQVLTDPVTGYVLSAMTKVHHDHNKFHETDVGSLRKYRYAPNSFLDYAIEGGWFLIVNLRDGQPSANGRKSKHWPEDIMYVSRYYPAELLEWLQITNNSNTLKIFTNSLRNHFKPSRIIEEPLTTIKDIKTSLKFMHKSF